MNRKVMVALLFIFAIMAALGFSVVNGTEKKNIVETKPAEPVIDIPAAEPATKPALEPAAETAVKYNSRADKKLEGYYFIEVVAFATKEVIAQFKGAENFTPGLANINEIDNEILKRQNAGIALNITFGGVFNPQAYGANQVIKDLNEQGCSKGPVGRNTLFVLFADNKTWEEKVWDFPGKINQEKGVGKSDPPGALFSGDPTATFGNPVSSVLFLHEAIGHVYDLGHSTSEADVMYPKPGIKSVMKTFIGIKNIDKEKKLNTC